MTGTAQPTGTASHQRGLKLFQSGSYDEAAAELMRALRCGETAERWNDWASVQYAMNHAEEAERGFRRALALEPENPQPATNLAVLLSQVGRKKEAVTLLEQSREKLAPEEQRTAARLLESCQGVENSSKEPEEWRGELELGLVELNQLKNLPQARQSFERACKLNPEAGMAWFFLGLTSFRMNLFDAARNALQKAELCGHKTALTAQMRGDAYYNLNYFTEARAAYQTAMNRDPQNSAIRARLGLALVRAGFVEKGLARLEADLAAMPQAPELYEGLILSHIALGQKRHAAEFAEQKLKRVAAPYAGDYLRAASLWAELQEWTRARTILEAGVRAHPTDENLTYALREHRKSAKAATLQNS
jgi:tetratricopeptide (TPR) repeat protein